MRRSYKRTLAVIALQLFAAHACAVAAQAVGSQMPREAGAFGSASTVSGTSKPSSAQRRRRRRRSSSSDRRLRLADALTPGIWGGEHIRFEATESGARIDLDCAHAAVEGKIYVDRAGRFGVAGTYYREHGGPVREEEEARGERVRLDGSVGGSLMKLTVTRGGTRVGTYTLTRDREARVVKCR
ncbi:MAG: hypothetical protein ACJ74Q_02240 [Pyrinomonadaceae bacterium]